MFTFLDFSNIFFQYQHTLILKGMKNVSMKNILTRLFEYFFEVVEVDEDGHEIKKQQDS